MNLIYVIDYRFARTPDGVIWTDTAYDHAFWEPYLQVFDKVTLVSRVRDVAGRESSWLQVSSGRVTVESLPHYLGPKEFLLRSREIRARMRSILAASGVVMLRVPSQLSSVAAGELRRLGKNYATEVVGDASAAFAPGVVRVKGRALMRQWFTRSQERICRESIANAYVAKCLHLRYPANKDAQVLVSSDVRLDDGWMRPQPRHFEHPGRHIVTVATLSQTYKGIDVLLRALAECRSQGHPFRLTIIGHGKYQRSLEALAAELSIDNAVRFAGCLPWGASLIQELDTADLFVLPSRVEALPRALLESMARALPSIATRVGAVPELLSHDQLVSPGNVAELARKMIESCTSAERLTNLSRRSIEMARRYSWRLLRPRWLEFYREIAASQKEKQDSSSRPKVVLLTTSPTALWVFFRDQAKFLNEHGFEVCAVSSPGPELDRFEEHSGCKVFPISMERSISPYHDAIAALKLTRLLRKLNPDILHTHTPKAGILGTLAGVLSSCPVRLHTYHGLRSETLHGPKRILVETMERWTGKLATGCFAVSSSLRSLLIHRHICTAHKLQVLGDGACAGVDMQIFDPIRRCEAGNSLRRHFGIAEDAVVVTYVGRMAREKGVGVLAEAWKAVREKLPNARLILCGPSDTTDPISAEAMRSIEAEPSIYFLPGLKLDVTSVLAAADIFVLPSFREGLGVAALEAAAMQVPTIATNVTGLVDTVVDGVTGILIPPEDSQQLASAIELLAVSPELCSRMGKEGRKFVAERFNRGRVFSLLNAEYQRVLENSAAQRGPVVLKRVFDLAVGIPALILAAPILAGTAIVIRVCLGAPAVFSQKRAGLNGEPFTLYKLRTMTDARDEYGVLLPDEQRLTRLGHLLRATSLDELPQLWNVVSGDMSLVGPRPLLERYLPRYSASQKRRHLVRPGITGWAQTHGRNALTWEKKFALDTWYVDHRSFILDLQILLRTVSKIFATRDVSAPGHCTMPEFLGNSGSLERPEVTLYQH